MGTRYLKENEKRLSSQTIRVSEDLDIDREELRELYAQKRNRRFLGIPFIHHLVYMYYIGLKRYDKDKFIRKKEKVGKKYDAKIAKTTNQHKINNLQFRKQKKIDKLNSRIENGNLFMQWGEPVAAYDSTLVQTTLQRFSNYLFTEGYFQNKVSSTITERDRTIAVSYQIDTEPPYIIDSIGYSVQDTTLLHMLQNFQSESHLRKGRRYREDDITRERERIDFMLKDNGYYDFSRLYVEFSVDTSMLGNHKAGIIVMINNPAKRGYHKQFVIDSVRFTTDAGVASHGLRRQLITYRDVQYSYYQNLYNLKILSQRLFIAPAQLYSRTNTFTSQRQLANLDAFKFVNINYDTSRGRFIANIFTSPLDRYEWSNEVGVNVTQGYPGPFYSINFKKRNIFRGLENFELNGRIGIEGVASAAEELNVYKSTEAGVNASLVFPQFLLPLRNATQIRFGRFNPKTRTSLGVTYTDRPEYKRTSTTFSNTYTWQNKRVTQFSLAVTNISLINSDIKSEEFRIRLDTLEQLGNYNLVRSFSPSLVSSMIFGMTWNRDYGTFDKDATFIRAQIESGGTTLNFLDTTLITKRGLQYFKYVRLNLDFRKVRVLTRWATVAYRLNSGIVYSYARNPVLPYEKFYFAGGSNSVRAWRPRRLGLGSVPPEVSDDPKKDGTFDYRFEKPGEILVEASIELRSKLVGFIDGAVFIDAGNVWAFRKVPSEITGNSQFRLNSFYRELGIGTGFGLRFDFTFLILRFDVGIKAYDPARAEGDRFVLDNMRFFGPFARKAGENNYYNLREPVIYNIGVGYPF